MTDEEFFKFIKGKPLRHSYWDKLQLLNLLYFLPTNMTKDGHIEGVRVNKEGRAEVDSWPMLNGFDADSHGDYWYIAYDIIAQQEISKLLGE
jgi:hypothetical protein